MAQVPERVVGGQAELVMFEQAPTDLECGGPATIEVVGEPGIGRTRLSAASAGLGSPPCGLAATFARVVTRLRRSLCKSARL